MTTLRRCLLTLLLAAGLRAAEQPPTLPLGASAPDFDLPGVDGRRYRLADFAEARVLVVVFTCNHCPTAQYYEERLKQIVTDYKPRGVALVAISPNDPKSVRLDELGWTDLSDSFEEMKLRAAHRQFNFPYLYDGDTETVSRAYGPVATPHVFVFDTARKLRYVGAVDDSERPQHVKVHYLRDALDALLADREPPVRQTKVVGCSVKWAGKADAVKAYLEKLAAEPVTVEKADATTLAALRKKRLGQVPAGELLGHVVRALRGGVPRTGHHAPHVPAPRLRAGDRLNQPAGRGGAGARVPEKTAGLQPQPPVRLDRPRGADERL